MQETQEQREQVKLERIDSKQQEIYMVKSQVPEYSDLVGATAEEEKLIGEGHYRLGKVYYDKADLVAAEEQFLKALKKTIYPRDSFAMFKCYGFLIRIYSESLREKEAQKYIEESESLAELFQRDMGSLDSNYFYDLGMVFTYKGKIEEALTNFTLSYQKAQKENEPELIAKAIYAMSNAAYSLGKYQDALSSLVQLKELLNILKK